MTKKFKLSFCLLIFGAVVFTASPALAMETVKITVVYPQASNAPKRAVKRTEKAAVLRGKVLVSVSGVGQKELKDPNLFVQYFLDNKLVYSTQEQKGGKGPLGFTLDTSLYNDGQHTLTANVWDKEGPSIIGMRKIIIKNNEGKK